MDSPRLEIDLDKIKHNIRSLKSIYASRGIAICGVTKGVCGHAQIAQLMVENGVAIQADSRLENLRQIKSQGLICELMLLGPPMISQAEEVVKYADISLNTELSTITALSKAAIKKSIIHQVIVMIELGDLREGVLPQDTNRMVKEVIKLKGVSLAGIGTNLACFAGVHPDQEKMATLSALAEQIEKKFHIELKYISGGNSANYTWLSSCQDIGRVNQMRLGESILLGRETLKGNAIPGLFTDAFTLSAEVVELKPKPSTPTGRRGKNSFGQTLTFEDKGVRPRAILGIGLQDVPISGLRPRSQITILGASSDHLIIDPEQSDLKIGSQVLFDLDYSVLLAAMTSPYLFKQNIEKTMSAKEYCDSIESKDIAHKLQENGFEIIDNGAPLVSLLDVDFELVYEPSVMKNYQYMIREPLIEPIGRIACKLSADDKTLVIRSGWRSFQHQKILWDRNWNRMRKKFPKRSEKRLIDKVSYFIAPPTKSTHSTGGAVDALILDNRTDRILDFGTNKGLVIDLNKRCYPHHPDISGEPRVNRDLLIGLFEAEGFVCDLKEFWHFDHGNIGWAIEKKEKHAIYGVIEKLS